LDEGFGERIFLFLAAPLPTAYKGGEQPLGIKLEYRVIAANHSGESYPSNTIIVVL
jgi:hypothetical protein